ncbi:MAG TPA: fatty acid desaturase [Chitinophagaceae bacterium]|jgi:fatty acid desaturase|nr:fatty acid desaturase [Chitinophagaceae bacterium]
MNNLEGIAYEDVSAPGGLSYKEWRTGLQPRYAIVWRDIILGYVALFLLLALSVWLQIHYPGWVILNIILIALATGYFIAYLSLFIHEAGHFNIHPDKKINDRLAAIFLCTWVGLDIKTYRKIHWMHHVHLGTPEDTEISYHNAITPSFILETITGLHLLKVIRKKSDPSLLTATMKKHSRNMLLAGLFLNALIVAGAIYSGFWHIAVIWCAAMFIFFPFFATMRQILEHRSELAEAKTDYTRSPHGKLSRLFVSGLFSSSFGAAGFNKHMIHHWDPQVSYTRLKDIEQFLLQCDAVKNIVRSSQTSYLVSFKKLISAK